MRKTGENESMQLGLKNLKDRYSYYNVEPEVIELKETYFVKIPLLAEQSDKGINN